MAKRSLHLVQILVPLMTGKNTRLEKSWFDELLQELTDRFGGATSFVQSPGQGIWDSGKQIEKDNIAVDRSDDRRARRGVLAQAQDAP